tara:strand:- start:9804 stop:10592 length:789 start_codon:yes stop_codon:yes gene_type:complete
VKIDHKESYSDFGNQFTVDDKIDDYWGSKEMFLDVIFPFDPSVLKKKDVMEVGSGSGRILKNLLKFSPRKIYSIEPSKAIEVAKKNNKSDKIQFINIKGEDINFVNKFDYIFSLGVIHHIPDGNKVVRNIHKALKKNGKFVCWVYGYEGNELYIFLFNNLRRITSIIPDKLLRIISSLLNCFLYIYIFLCKFLKLPLRHYLLKHFNKLSFEKRNYTIFDQLNPSYSKYYKKEEILNLMKSNNFKNIEIFHRHKYSWTIIAEK